MTETIKREKGKFSTIILAAGKGTRMSSPLAKVLHTICKKPMLSYPVALARELGSKEIVVIVGYQAELVKESFKDEEIVFVHQREQMGTGHAVLQARDKFVGFNGDILVLCGDVPLLLSSTVKGLLDCHFSTGATITVLTTVLDTPTGYGRIVKENHDDILRIVEERDATAEEKKIREINTGIYCVQSRFLFEAVADIGNKNAQGEYYLTDIFEIARERGYSARSFVTGNPDEVMGINTMDDLKKASRIIASRSGG